ASACVCCCGAARAVLDSLSLHDALPIFLHELSLRPAEAVFVGDSLTDDVQGPQDVGMRACWLNRKGIVPEGVKPDFQIHSLEQRSEEHTSELQSRFDLVCRLLLEKKRKV